MTEGKNRIDFAALTPQCVFPRPNTLTNSSFLRFQILDDAWSTSWGIARHYPIRKENGQTFRSQVTWAFYKPGLSRTKQDQLRMEATSCLWQDRSIRNKEILFWQTWSNNDKIIVVLIVHIHASRILYVANNLYGKIGLLRSRDRPSRTSSEPQQQWLRALIDGSDVFPSLSGSSNVSVGVHPVVNPSTTNVKILRLRISNAVVAKSSVRK